MPRLLLTFDPEDSSDFIQIYHSDHTSESRWSPMIGLQGCERIPGVNMTTLARSAAVFWGECFSQGYTHEVTREFEEYLQPAYHVVAW